MPATLHACEIAPLALCGGSPSYISESVPTLCSVMVSSNPVSYTHLQVVKFPEGFSLHIITQPCGEVSLLINP